MRTRSIIGGATVLAAGIVLVVAFNQERRADAAPKDDEQAIRKATDAYVAAFNKGDTAAALALWAEDAEYVDEYGVSTKGRAALTVLFNKIFADRKGVKLQIKPTTFRFLKDDIVLQDGEATITETDGETEANPFTSVWMKKDGKWQLQLARDLSGQGGEPAGPHPRLKDLGWLVGEWQHEEKDTKTTVNARWMKGGKFLIVDIAVHEKGEETMSMIQVVGWDPTLGQLHSWVFDTRGGFGEGHWSRKGGVWTAEVAGITADGRQGEGTNHYRQVDDNSFTFEGTDRLLDGQPMPDVKIVFQRVKKAK